MTMHTFVAGVVGLSFAAIALADGRSVRVETVVNTCFDLPNAAVIRAIQQAESQAQLACPVPVVLRDLDVDIEDGSRTRCGEVEVEAKYSCMD